MVRFALMRGSGRRRGQKGVGAAGDDRCTLMWYGGYWRGIQCVPGPQEKGHGQSLAEEGCKWLRAKEGRRRVQAEERRKRCQAEKGHR